MNISHSYFLPNLNTNIAFWVIQDLYSLNHVQKQMQVQRINILWM